MTNRKVILYKEFPGDEAWAKFVESFPMFNSNALEVSEVESDIVRVLYWKKGNNIQRVIEWLSKPIPALNDLAPKALLGSKDGERVLKTLLMRMP